ncbi:MULTISPECIES: hypothetical protein [unclassified Streptomyces]
MTAMPTAVRDSSHGLAFGDRWSGRAVPPTGGASNPATPDDL